MHRSTCLALVLLAAATPRLSAQAPVRENVLKQVAVPHPYYWREMYVPQVTSGPSAATWSPDGAELIYSMQGTLWRQRVGTTSARQLTDGVGYDHQPDWSPDGRWVVYSSYHSDQMELRILDLTTGESRALVNNGAVNLDAHWAPDGSKIAYVSTSHEGRWHVFVAPVANGRLGMPVRVTEVRNSGLPRYYYSPWDHYLSPTWSPDSRELILVSNRGRIMGSGGFWRTEARPDAPMREIWYEETTWKAQPDWARDGKRVVYSGYHGRQWNQLWLMTSDGGDPMQLTYGEYDATNPRWSPDGRRIAFIANSRPSAAEARGVDGGTSLWVLQIPGGRATEVVATTRTYVRARGGLIVTVLDPSGIATPARVAVFDSTGKSWAPDNAWRHGDEAFVRRERQFEYGYFHTAGNSTVSMPSGRYSVEVWKGPEYQVARRNLTIAQGRPLRDTIRLGRIADLARDGWWGGDLHVHMNYGGHYRNTPAQLKRQAQAEGLHVVENLIVNKEQRIPDIAYWRPGVDPVSTADFVLAHAEEFHTSFWGHSALIGLRDYFILPNYASYVNTGVASPVPMNLDVFDLARAQGALTAYVHPFDDRPDPNNRAQPLRYEMPIDVALGKIDYFEVMGYSDHLITSEFWYRLLNNGFRIPAGAGTDAFPNYATLRGPPGLLRVYARGGPTLDHRRWLDAIKAGRTFVTNSAILQFNVRTGGAAAGPWRGIGDSLALPAGPQQLDAQITLRSNTPMDHLELVRNGVVVASIPLRGDRMRADTVVRMMAQESGWYVLRAYAARPALPVLDLYPFASTSPIYVYLGGRPVRHRQDAEYFITWIDRVREEAERHAGYNTADERATVLGKIGDARAEFVRRRDEAPPATIRP